MPDNQLEVFHSRSDRSEVISCHGWIDTTTCDELERVIDAAFEHGAQRVRLDLWNVIGVDEAGLRCLETTATRCVEAGIALELETSQVVQEALAKRADRFTG